MNIHLIPSRSLRRFIPLFIMATLASNSAKAQEGVITFDVGSMAITVLSEGQQQDNKGILIGATDEMLKETMPKGTYPSSVNAFLVENEGKNLLFDAALGKKLFDNLKAYGKTPQDIDAVLITHMHGDHIGGLLRNGEKAFPKAELYIAQPEYDYWVKQGNAQALRVIEVYKDKLHLFVPGRMEDTKELLPGVRPVAAYGHTPGHTGYMLKTADGAQLFIWGDLTHAMAVQMPYPQVAVTYDVDPEQAVKSRLQILKYLAENNIRIAGMHNAFPAVGDVAKNQAGGYGFTPVCECEGR